MGQFCAECGQRDMPAAPPFGELAREAWDEFISIDGKVLRTFRLLLLKPGALTREYVQGRRARFLPPLRLYLLCTVLFFLGDGLMPATRRPPIRVRTSADSVRFHHRLDSIQALPTSALQKRHDANFSRMVFDHYDFPQAYSTMFPRTLFLLMPFCAVLIGLMYYGRSIPYTVHLIVSLHLHAFVFVAIALPFITAGNASLIHGVSGLTLIPLAALFWLFVYIAMALRRVYDDRVLTALARTLALVVVYTAAVVGTFLLMYHGLILTYA